MKMVNELIENSENMVVVGYEAETMFSGTIYAVDTFTDEVYTQYFYLKDGDGFNVEYHEIEKSDMIETAFYDDIMGNLMPVDWLDETA